MTVSKRATEVAARDRQAVALRLAGATFRAIAAQLGYQSPSTAQDAVQRALGKHAENVEELRALEMERLDAMQAALWSRALGSPAVPASSLGPARAAVPADVEAVAAVLRIMGHRAKIGGLYKEPTYDLEDELRKWALSQGLDPEDVLEEAERHIRASGGKRR